jgi:hypothetical protein
MRLSLLISSLILATTTISEPLHAGIVFTVYERGSSVEVNVSGSIDTSGWNLQGIQTPNPFIRYDSIAVGSSQTQRIDGSGQVATGGANPHFVLSQTLGFVQPIAGTATGSSVQFSIRDAIFNHSWILYLPANYVSNAPVSGSALYANVSLASLGLTRGGTPWTWYLDGNTSNDAKSVTIVAPVPEPGSMAACGIAASAAAWLRRRRAGRPV